MPLESTIPDGRRRRRPGLSQTKTNSAQAEAGARAELGNNVNNIQILLCSIRNCHTHYIYIYICENLSHKFEGGGCPATCILGICPMKTPKDDPKIKSKSNVRIEGNLENESCSTT